MFGNTADTSQALPIPDALEPYGSTLLLYVQFQGKARSLANRAARSLALGTLSAALTGGNLITVNQGEYCLLKVLAVDLAANQVVWFNEIAVIENYKLVEHRVKKTLSYYPLVEGRYLTLNERRDRLREPRGNPK